MKQPKTVEEFMALPDRTGEIISSEVVLVMDSNRAELEARLGKPLPLHTRTVVFPVLHKVSAVHLEDDTIAYVFSKDGPTWALGMNENGLYRRRM